MANESAKQFDDQPLSVKVVLLVVLCVGTFVAAQFSLISPLNDELENARDHKEELRTQLQQAHQEHQEFLRLNEELARRESIDRANRRILPEQAEIASFLQDLNRLSELAGMQLRGVQPQEESAEELYIAIPVRLNLRARHHQLARFFYNVSRLERAINIRDIHILIDDSVTIEPGENAERAFEIEVTAQAVTFRRPTEAEAAAAAQGAAAQAGGHG